jgi:hypothetical protein
MRGLISQLTQCGGPRWSNVGTSASPSDGLGKCHHVTIEHVQTTLAMFGPSHSTLERRMQVKLGIVESAMTFSACAISEKVFRFCFP